MLKKNINIKDLTASERQALRVVLKNLIYITNIDPSLTVQTLNSKEFLGQYGQIKKTIVRMNMQARAQSAYVTFSTEQEAQDCMLSLSESWYNGYQMRVQFGTSKFCFSFLNGQKCNNPDCLFLHDASEGKEMFLAYSGQKPRSFALDLPSGRITYDKNRYQTEGFPPSWTHVQQQQVTNTYGDFVCDPELQKKIIQAAISMSTLQLGRDFVFIGK